MGYSSNFTTATLGDDGGLSVQGVTTFSADGGSSVRGETEPSTSEDRGLMTAAVLRAGEILPPVTVDGDPLTGFAASFARPGKPFQEDEEIMVAGAAVFPNGQMLVWSNHGRLEAGAAVELFPPESPPNP